MTASVLFSASVTEKTVGCESIQNLNKAHELIGTKHFIKFLVMGRCQVLQKDSKVKVLGENNDFLKITPLNQRELWVKKETISQ